MRGSEKNDKGNKIEEFTTNECKTKMEKFILIPDSFKGSLSSLEICGIMESSIKKYIPGAVIVSIPVADGGEGTVDAFLSGIGGIKKTISVRGPFGKPVDAFYGIIYDTNQSTAIIEMAACAGLPLALETGIPNPEITTTFGAGELIHDALDNAASKIILGLGGSCTNDGGCGAAAALGVRFFDKAGNSFIPTGGTLKNIHNIDSSNLDRRLRNTEIICMCDINNPLFGPQGAAYIFAPQKGADSEMIKRLDAGLAHLADITKRDLGIDAALIAGTGAAGGMGYGAKVFFYASLQSGIDVVLDTVNFDKLTNDVSLIFTGEGKVDTQSLYGKVISGIAKRAKKHNIPVVAVVGDIGDGIDDIYELGVSAIFSINQVAVDFATAKLRSASDLAKTMDNIMRLWKVKTFV